VIGAVHTERVALTEAALELVDAAPCEAGGPTHAVSLMGQAEDDRSRCEGKGMLPLAMTSNLDVTE
jgi:hypothetical protein